MATIGASRVIAICASLVLVLLAGVRPAHGWIENHVLGSEVRLELDRSGKALVELRVTMKTNGNRRQHQWTIRGVDRDAVAAPNSYVIPIRHALANSLDSATPVSMQVVHPKQRRRDQAGAGRR